MKKKALFFVGIAAVLLVCIAVYFKPLVFSDEITDGENQIDITITEFAIANGEPSITPTTYSNVENEQKEAVFALLEDYSYRRTPTTPFSDGTIDGLGGKMLTLYAYDENSLTATVVIASSGEVVVGDRRYKMKNADKLIEQIDEAVEQID